MRYYRYTYRLPETKESKKFVTRFILIYPIEIHFEMRLGHKANLSKN